LKVIQSETVGYFNKFFEEFQSYFRDFKNDTPVMGFTGNPFRLLVEDLLEDEDIKNSFWS